MINGIMQNSRMYSLLPGTLKTESGDDSFGEILAITNSIDDELMKNAPDKWVTEPGISDNAVKAALEYKKNVLGMDTSAEPTHELTPEQREWLYSRYDFSTMQTKVYESYMYGSTMQYRIKSTSEYSNFLADLAYPGFFSRDDFIITEPIDTRPGGFSILSGTFDTGSSDLRGTARAFVSHLEDMFNFYDSRSKDPLKAVEGDKEFAVLIKEHYLPKSQRFFEFIDKLLSHSNSNKQIQQPAKPLPIVENCSEKMKQDFCKVLA